MTLNKTPLALMLASISICNAALAQPGAAPDQAVLVVTVSGKAENYRPTTSTT